jgi:predicted ArsR family transcriptional regulator
VSTLQEQARALGDPTRHDIFRHVADAKEPVGIAALTDAFGLNHNAIRQHLTKLVEAALVIERTAPSTGPGRPRLVYTVDPAADGRWGMAGPYERLSLWMAEIIRSGDTPVEVGRRVGASRRVGGPAVDGVSALVDEMARDGFEPVLRQRGRTFAISLESCPFVTTALADPDTVCQLHLGIAQGIVDRGGSGVVVDELVAKDPRRARCRLRGHLEPPS